MSTASAFAELIGAHPGHEIVLDGDVFGLSNDPRGRDPIESVGTLVSAHPELVSSMRKHLSRGFPMTLIAGNHDAAIAVDGMREGLLSRLEIHQAAPLAIEPWFVRRGEVHIEHGHVWDPDNAPSHPLAPWSPNTEPLGIQLTRRFVARHGVWEFAHAHETTLVDGLTRAFRLFGVRAPLLVGRYFATSALICAETLFDRGLLRDREHGQASLAKQAEATGMDVEALWAVLSEAPRPTHLDFHETFLRLYYDRVISAASIALGTFWGLTRASPAGMTLALAAGAYWSWNVRHYGSRYRNQPVRLLRDGANTVARLTGAKLVVFGHTHVPELDGCYANGGSFGYPARGSGRPYLLVTAEGAAELRHHRS